MAKKVWFGLLFCFLLFLVFPLTAMAQGESHYQLSNPWVTTLIHKVEIKNPNQGTISNLQIQVPLMDKNLPVYQELIGEEFSPQPQSVQELSDGTRVANFTIPSLAAGQTIVLEQRFVVRTYDLNYTVNPMELNNNALLPNQFAPYLREENNVEISNQIIREYMEETIGNESNPYYIARRLFADINLYLTYQQIPVPASSALTVLKEGFANCEGYTNLFLATTRAAGIPSRRLYGYHYSLANNDWQVLQTANGHIDANKIAHTWPEFYIDPIGWIFADPTSTYTTKTGGQEIKLIDWDRFARITSQQKYIFFSRKWGADTAENGFPYTYKGPQPDITFQAEIAFGSYYSPFKDITNNWAREDILYLYNTYPGLLSGKTTTEFMPNDHITRAETAALLNRCDIDGIPNDIFYMKDVGTAHWAYMDIYQAQSKGFISGYPDGSFQPEASLSRAELAAILVRSFQIPIPQTLDTPFNDLNQNGYGWAASSINALYQAGLVSGTSHNQYSPQEPVTRAQMAAILNRIFHSTYYSQS